MYRSIKVSLADPHPITLDGLAQAFAGSRRFDVVSASTTSAAAFEAVRGLRPDLFVTDLRLPCDGGVALLTKLQHAFVQSRVLVLCDSLSPDAIARAGSLGIHAFVSKCVGSEVILAEAMRMTTLLPAEAPRFLGFDDDCDSYELEMLSARERDILPLAARGLSNKEIALELGITHGTVKVHLHAIYRKLGVSRRAELARFTERRRVVAMVAV
jgi:two-component system, NarL family, nitrate/nitrite response regulator NarL